MNRVSKRSAFALVLAFALLAGLVLVSYFVGNINFALIISKLKKSDVR